MTKIMRKAFEEGTLSAPAWIDLFLEDGVKISRYGKVAKRLNLKYNEGDDYDEAQ